MVHRIALVFWPDTDLSCTGMMSAAASLGLSLLWETEVGISHVDKYTYSAEEHIKVCSLNLLTQAYPI